MGDEKSTLLSHGGQVGFDRGGPLRVSHGDSCETSTGVQREVPAQDGIDVGSRRCLLLGTLFGFELSDGLGLQLILNLLHPSRWRAANSSSWLAVIASITLSLPAVIAARPVVLCFGFLADRMGHVVNQLLSGSRDSATGVELNFPVHTFDLFGWHFFNKARIFELLQGGANDVA